MPGVCPRCLREVYFAEEKLALGKVWHTFCFSCRNCRKLLDSCTVATHCGELFCRNCCIRLFTPSVQPPAPIPTLDLTVEHRGPPFSSGPDRVSACDSLSECYCCCCCPEDFALAEVHPEPRSARLEKQRLRGGGGEEEEETEEFRLVEDTRRCSESECSNLGIVSSVTTLCNVPSSPTAVTTWYNRQHSASQSTFGGQPSTKRHSARPCNTPSPGTAGTNFRSNNSDCLNSSTNCAKGAGHKCSVARRPGSPCRSFIQHHQPRRQHQQSQREEQESHQQEDPFESHLSLQPPQQQQTDQKQQKPQQQNLQPEPQQNQLQQLVRNINFDRKSKNICHQPPVGYLRKRGKPATPSLPPTSYYRHEFPRRRVSFCSDVPEEPNRSSSTSESSNSSMKMPNDNTNNNNNNNNNQNQTNSIHNTSNNISNCTSSNQSCNESPYETCYEMDDLTVPGYSTASGGTSYNCSSNIPEDGDPDPTNFNNEQEESRLRGGCGGGRSSGCGCGGSSCVESGGCGGCPTRQIIQPCPPRDECREPEPPCGTPSCDPPCGVRPGCCPPVGCRPVCRKPIRSCCPPCTAEPQGCGGGGCCGGGCRGGCGKPGRLCMPLRPCSSPPCQPQVRRPGGSPCMPPRSCAPIPPCCKSPVVTFRPSCGVGGGGSCCRSKSPRRGCCSSPQDDVGCGYCGPRLPPGCECLGGGLDCQRCGRKVYQAEMQIASGVPYHNICFSCFCCRKPLEPLTYQENCGEIYCKQCYVRNFGPQGYGYGAGAGVLQTPM